VSATEATHHAGSYLMPTLDHATVADAMHPGVLSCDPDATLTELAQMMATHHVHSIAVVGLSHDQPGETIVLGIVSDLDVLEAGVRTAGDHTAAVLARQPVISVEPSTALRDAAEMMLTEGTSHLLVIEPRGHRPVGVLSTLDIAGVLAWGEA
jgi:CBS domain-containing protein